MVVAVGPDVTNVSVGDRVTYTGAYNTLGAYCTERLIPAAPLIRLPNGIACETATAMTVCGLTFVYLMRRIYDYKRGDTILLHAATGGVASRFDARRMPGECGCQRQASARCIASSDSPGRAIRRSFRKCTSLS